MKTHFYVCVALCLTMTFSSKISGQEDLQWLIRESKGKDGILNAFANNYPGQAIAAPFKFEGIAAASAAPFENEYMAIFSDGTYSFTVENAADPEFSHLSPSSASLQYFYLTNKYEGDDLPQNVKKASASSGSSFAAMTNPDRFFNHSIVEDKDITLILNPLNKQIANYCSTNVKICYNDGNINFVNSPFKTNFNTLIQNTGSNLSYASISFVQTPGSSEKCISITDASKNIFLNFRPVFLNNTPPEAVEFYLKCSNSNSYLFEYNNGKIPVTTRFHDPNYVELMCVWEEKTRFGTKKFARYHVECYNDGNGDVSVLQMALSLPNKVKLHPQTGAATVNIEKWSAGNISGCGESAKLVKTVNGSYLQVKFDPHQPYSSSLPPVILHALSPGNIPEQQHKAWFEFCVELLPLTNLSHDPLQPSIPQTTFAHQGQTEIYPITTFIDKTNKSRVGEKPGSFKRNPKMCKCSCRMMPASSLSGGTKVR